MALQFQVLLPEGATPLTNGEGTDVSVTPNPTRFASVPAHLTRGALQSDNSVKVVSTSLFPGVRFSGADAPFCTIPIDVSGLEPGEYPVIIKSEANFSGFDGDSQSETTGHIIYGDIISKIVITKLIGDVNRDGLVNVADITAIVNIIHGRDQASYNYDYDAADMNDDGVYNVVDVTALINLIHGRN